MRDTRKVLMLYIFRKARKSTLEILLDINHAKMARLEKQDSDALRWPPSKEECMMTGDWCAAGETGARNRPSRY